MKHSLQLVEQVRRGLFLAASRTYAEQYVEPIIREKYKLLEPSSDDHDAISVTGVKYEIKACKVLRLPENSATDRSILDRVLYENMIDEVARAIPFDRCLSDDFLANIQNVKRSHFEFLIYVLLFKDLVKVFEVKSIDIKTGKIPSWSDKHGRYDAEGMSGQFPITRNTIEFHLDNYLKDTLNYSEVTELLMKLSDVK